MATEHYKNQLNEALKRLSSVDIERLKRSALGEESLAESLEPRQKKIDQLANLAKTYAPLVHDNTCQSIYNNIESMAQVMINQAALDSSAYIAEKANFLQAIDNLIESANEWKPIVVGAAILERGLLEDEGLKRESERALENLKRNTEETLAIIKSESEKSIEGAKELAEEIETRARRTATKISVKEAQNQFQEASAHDAKQIKI
jgi:hypothetical protein